MAPAPAKSPKSEVNDWCLFHTEGAQKADYLTEGDGSKPPTYRCTLTLPDGRQFCSNGGHKKKKDAEQAAAESAMQAIGRSEAEPADGPPFPHTEETAAARWQLLKSRLEASLAHKNVTHFSPLSPFFSMAALTGGSIPLAVIAQVDNRIASALRGVDLQAEADPLRGLALLVAAVRESPDMQLSEDGLGVLRTQPWPDSLVKRAGAETCEPASSPPGSFRAVFLPQDKDRPPADISLPKKPGGLYLVHIAEVLGLKDANRVLLSRTVGKSGSNLRIYSALPPLSTAYVSTDGTFSFVPAESHKGNGREGSTETESSDLKFGSNTEMKDRERNEGGKEGPLPDTGSDEQTEEGDWTEHSGSGGRNERNGRNGRASWVAGHAVYGDAIVASVGTTYSSLGKLRWDDITSRDWHSLLLSRHPRGMYQLSRGAPLAATLPRTYPGSSRWTGKSAKTLLFDLGKPKCSGAGDKEPVYTLSDTTHAAGVKESEGGEACRESPAISSGDNETETMNELGYSEPGRETGGNSKPGWEAKVEFVFGYQSMKASSGGRWPSPRDTENAAALAGLHAVQALFDAQVLTRDAEKEEEQLGKPLNTEHDGTAIVAYRIVSETGGVLEENRGFLVPRGTGAVLPQIEACLDTCQHGEERSFRMRPLASWQPFLIATCPVGNDNAADSNLEPHAEALGNLEDLTVEVRFCGHVEPREQRLEGALFTPSLATQRMDFALRLVEQCEAASVLDLGCGSGAFLEVVVERATCVRRLAGADVSERALARARRAVRAKLEKRAKASGEEREEREGAARDGGDTLDRMEKKRGALTEKNVEIIERSMLELDERFVGWDVATCIEVVEHLDPVPLAAFGPAVLGRLRPKVLLVSTPNIEYNPVLQAAVAGTRAGAANDEDQPARLRNDDHRFEWTRAEFRAWAETLAAEFEYSVEFSGVGGEGTEEGPGFCTQIAVFRKTGQDERVNERNH